MLKKKIVGLQPQHYLESHNQLDFLPILIFIERTMKFLTTNFVQCAVKSCARSSDSFPLSYAGVELVQQEVDYDPDFIVNILPKLEWNALLTVAKEVSINGGERRW